jgi:Fur family transcriptional regulator, peroxide stress response regulator
VRTDFNFGTDFVKTFFHFKKKIKLTSLKKWTIIVRGKNDFQQMNFAHKKRIQYFEEICRENKLPITPQKLEIFKFLASTTAHPSAQEIFQVMKKKFPRISFSTVYKNLKKLKILKLVREIEMKNNIARFDANLADHHHIINLDSGEILDVFAEQIGEIPIPEQAKNFTLEGVSVNFFVRDKK